MAGKGSKAGAKAAGMAKGVGKLLEGETGILRHLATEHGEVSTLMQRVASSSRDSRIREELFPEIRAKLLAHAKAEEATFYPVLREQPGMEALIEQSLKEHHMVEEMLTQLASADPHTESWDQTFGKLKTAVEQHVQLEEEEVFPLAKDRLDGSRREEMLERYEEQEKAIKARLS